MPKPRKRMPASGETEKAKPAGSLRVLIVEDVEGDAALVIRRLESAGYRVESQRVEDADGIKSALASSRWDVVISDFRLPEFDAFGSLAVLRESRLDIPFIVVSGTIGEETAVALMKAGAHDYVMKGNLTRLAPAIERELGDAEIRGRRQAAEALLQSSEKKFRDLVEQINDGIFTLNARGIITYASPPALLLTGRTAESLVRRHFSEIIHPDDLAGVEKSFRDTLENRIYPMEFRYFTGDGKLRWARTSSRPVSENGRIIGIRGVFSDITDQKRMENQIKDDLKEKETLLKEVHHRVKNNMQIVISLLNLQSADIEDPAILSMFKESRNRIFSMALVHEMLYGSEKFSSIDFGRYLARLVENIEEAYKTGSRPVAFHIEADVVELGIEDAIPCGLMVQEIVSNAHKHAFPEAWKGEPRIHIRITAEGGMVDLTIRDNGIGIPGRVSFDESKSLGMTLIRLLGKDQLGGEVSVESGEAGTEFKIRFKAE